MVIVGAIVRKSAAEYTKKVHMISNSKGTIASSLEESLFQLLEFIIRIKYSQLNFFLITQPSNRSLDVKMRAFQITTSNEHPM